MEGAAASPRVWHVGTGLDVIVAALLGLFVGAVATLAFHVSERERRSEHMSESGPVSEDEARMLAAVPDAAVVLDGRGDVVRANVRALQFHLVLADRLAHPQLSALVERFRERRTSQEEDLVLRRGPSDQAGVLHMHVSVAPLARDRVLILARDQTAARRLDETRRDFVANVSHELKTPVGAMSLLVEALAEAKGDPEAVEHFSESLTREAKRLSMMITELISLSKLQGAEALPDMEPLKVSEIIDAAVHRTKILADQAGITVGTVCEEGLMVMGDRSLLITAVSNLITNAVNYSPEQTPVSVSVKMTDGDTVAIRVTDRGIGISLADQERIFERFFRVDKARSRSTGGTGLGLAIVKHVVANHKGAIKIWSRPGTGSTFTLELPALKKEG